MSTAAAAQARVRAQRCASCTHRRDSHVSRVVQDQTGTDVVVKWCRDCSAECAFASEPAPEADATSATNRPGCPRPDKIGHATRGGAEREADALNAARKGFAFNVGPYRCVCEWWHVGNPPRRRKGKQR